MRTLWVPLLTAGLAFFAETEPARACAWDRDTLLMERLEFPSALELITGKFLRHSRAFYAWRIADRTAKLAADPKATAAYDDIAVAYDKTGDQGRAIAAMLLKERMAPGLYETYANLGTFLIHGGQLEAGVKVIDLAITVNPNAHFGREIYQKLLVEYVLSGPGVAGGMTLPLRSARGDRNAQPERARHGFAAFLKSKNVPAGKPAVKGVLGMMKFGDHTSPILLEALGDLLLGSTDPFRTTGPRLDAKQLAARAYLKASYEANTKKLGGAEAYDELAREAVQSQLDPVTQDPLKFSKMERQLSDELREAEAWHQKVVNDEETWIREGKDPEKEFEAKYYKPRSTKDEPVL